MFVRVCVCVCIHIVVWQNQHNIVKQLYLQLKINFKKSKGIWVIEILQELETPAHTLPTVLDKL